MMHILERAYNMRLEQEEEIQKCNRLILETKCRAIRDAQVNHRLYNEVPHELMPPLISNFRTFSCPLADRGKEADGTGAPRGGETAERHDGRREKMGGQGGVAEGAGGGSQESSIRQDPEGADRGEQRATDPRVREEAGGEPTHQFK